VAAERLPITGLVLAGGQGSRMGGRDKGLVEYRGRPLVDHAIASLSPQVDELIISANRNLDDYARRGFSVVSDTLPDFQGPLAGVLAGLQAASHEWVLVVPCDMPRLPDDLAERLMQASRGAALVVAGDGVRSHPAVMLIQTALAEKLASYLASGKRSVHGFQESVGFAQAAFDPQAMANINSLDSGE
jgi:molybdopterin-guanine dinucleotide biosynthesis protein A